MSYPLVACCVLVCAGRAWAEPRTVEVWPSRDATLYQSGSGGVANGSGQHVFAGVTLREGSIRRGLLWFDVASAVPARSRVVSVTLTMNMSRSLRDQPSVVTLHPVGRAWSEGPTDPEGEEGAGGNAQAGDCTWNHTNRPGERWGEPGGDFGAAVAEVEVNSPGVYVWPTGEALVALVQGWVDEPAGNFGLLVKGDEGGSGNAKRFDSREHADRAAWPLLRVGFACGADFNGDGRVDFSDYSGFVGCFEGGACAGARDADFNDDGFVDFFDYEGFVGAYETGC